MARPARDNIPAVILWALCITGSLATGDMQRPKQLVSGRLGSTRNVHAYGSTLMCGQPSAEELIEAKKRGFQIVVSLRQPDEIDWNEAETVRGLGMEFLSLPFQAPDALVDQIFDKTRELLRNSQKKHVLLHCGSANRVGAIWLSHRVLDHGLTLEKALKEAKTVGLRTEAYRDKAIDYIKRRQ